MSESTLRAIVLVGGEGTRLRPLTLTRPKPMLPVNGVSILEHKLVHLASHGVTDVVLSLGYKPDAFRSAFPTGSVAGIRLQYAVEPTPLDTAGAVLFAASAAGFDDTTDGPLIVVNGDVITGLDLTEQIAFHRRSGAEATLALTRVEDPSAFGVVPTDVSGRVLDFVEKPDRGDAPTDWINAGAYVIESSVLRRISPDQKVSIERVVFPAIVADRALFAVRSPSYWIDAGTPATYLEANLDELRRSGAVPSDAMVHPTALVTDAVVGSGVRIGAGATVKRSVLLPHAVVEDGATVVDSIVGEGACISARASIAGLSVVGDGSVVGPGSDLHGERVG